MPTELVFDPWTLAFLLALFALLGALCAYLGGMVWDKPESPRSLQYLVHAFMREDGIVVADPDDQRLADAQWLADRLLKFSRRMEHIEKWKKRFIAHHNREHAAAVGKVPLNAEFDAALALHRQHIDRHEKALTGLIAANGDMNGLKAFVDAIHAVQNKQEDRLAKIERDDANKIAAMAAWGNLHDRLEAIELRLGGKEGMAAIERVVRAAKGARKKA